MLRNKDRSFKLVAREALSELSAIGSNLNAAWDFLALQHYPAGLDYFLLDTAIECGAATVSSWVDRLHPDLEDNNFLSSLEFFRRRRMKADPAWSTRSVEWSNRVNRVKRRALKMLGESRAIPPELEAQTTLKEISHAI